MPEFPPSLRPWTLLVPAAMALAACGGGSSDSGTALTDTDAADAAATAATETEATGAPNRPDDDVSTSNPAAELLGFSAEALDGTTVNIGDFVGQDLVVWFWEPH